MVGVVGDPCFYFKSWKRVLKCILILSLAIAFFSVYLEESLFNTYSLIAYYVLGVFAYHAKGNASFLCSEYFPFPQTFPLGLGDGQFYAWTDGLRRKDWHDYESIQKEAMRSGMKFSVSQSATLLTAVSHLSLKGSLISISSAYSKVCLVGVLESMLGRIKTISKFQRENKQRIAFAILAEEEDIQVLEIYDASYF